jgi:hypothetical protein
MSETEVSFRMYRAKTSDKRHIFVLSVPGYRNMYSDSVENLAGRATYLVRVFMENECLLVSIDFSPLHDIECPVLSAPMRCSALSEAEQEEFWREFTSNRR